MTKERKKGTTATSNAAELKRLKEENARLRDTLNCVANEASDKQNYYDNLV